MPGSGIVAALGRSALSRGLVMLEVAKGTKRSKREEVIKDTEERLA